ncbi:MAG: tetratricopeptide repeat protein [Thermoanaerobaculia bacterium]|nr:tetratricopeptide repeat protein [Thermoanaerobaculia bacterium]
MSEPGSAYRLSVLEERWRTDRSPRIFLQLSDELRRAGRAERALQVLRDGLQGRPESVSGWVALGRMLLEADDAAGAIAAFERALERDPGQLMANKLLTEGWIRLGDLDRAAASLERARLLSLPDADREQLADQIEALRRGEPGVAAGRTSPAAAPFELSAPAELPALDLGQAGAGRRGWRRVEIAVEPFAALLAPPRQAARLEHELRAAGIFGAVGAPAGAPEPGIAPVAAAPVLVAPVADEIAPAPPTVAAASAEIFQPQSIGEEVERESLAQVESEPPTPASTPTATTTLAALYLAQGHLDEAEREFREVLAARPADAEAQAGLARIAARRVAAAPAAKPPLGLTARRLHRLRGIYDRLRLARREARAHVP